MPKKKRWRPKDGEDYFFIDGTDVVGAYCWRDENDNNGYIREIFGVYKTREEGKIMQDKLKKFVESEIGEA